MWSFLPLLQSSLSSLTHGTHGPSLQALSVLQAEVKELIKFVALNYLAVVKAIKKRNKNMKVGRAMHLFGADRVLLDQTFPVLFRCCRLCGSYRLGLEAADCSWGTEWHGCI